jgi:hypothetical protein
LRGATRDAQQRLAFTQLFFGGPAFDRRPTPLHDFLNDGDFTARPVTRCRLMYRHHGAQAPFFDQGAGDDCLNANGGEHPGTIVCRDFAGYIADDQRLRAGQCPQCTGTKHREFVFAHGARAAVRIVVPDGEPTAIPLDVRVRATRHFEMLTEHACHGCHDLLGLTHSTRGLRYIVEKVKVLFTDVHRLFEAIALGNVLGDACDPDRVSVRIGDGKPACFDDADLAIRAHDAKLVLEGLAKSAKRELLLSIRAILRVDGVHPGLRIRV